MRRHYHKSQISNPILVISIPFDEPGMITDDVLGNAVMYNSNYNELTYDYEVGSYYIQGNNTYKYDTGWDTRSIRVQTSLPDPNLYDYKIEFDGRMSYSAPSVDRCAGFGFISPNTTTLNPFGFAVPTSNTAANVHLLNVNMWKHIKLFISYSSGTRKAWVDDSLQVDDTYTFLQPIDTNYFIFLTTRWAAFIGESSRLYIKNFTLHAIPRT